MTASRAAVFEDRPAMRRFLAGVVVVAAAVFCMTAPAPAQQPQSGPEARVIVTGEGSVDVAPDYARIRSGVTVRAKTAKEATDANTKQMAAVIAALSSAGIEQKDIKTARFSVQPIYESPEPRAPAKLTGFSVTNQVMVTIRQIAKVGDILDRLVTAGATDAGSVEFLHADLSKALDGAREAAVADARRKAELYARAADIKLGSVAWITEDSGYAPPVRMMAARAPAAAGTAVPISSGEDTLRVQITVGFDIAR